MIEKIISGGQTGIDRGALDLAIEQGIKHGGAVPQGRLAEDGRVPDRYQMTETPARAYPPRTEQNVRDADATAIFMNASLNAESGCLLTASYCLFFKKPYVVINLQSADEAVAAEQIATMIGESGARILNVAGTRGSRNPDVAKMKRILLRALELS